MLYRIHLAWAGFELTALVVIGTDCIGSYISNYHTIMTTTTPSNSFDVVPGRFAPNPVRPLSRFAPIPVRPGSFRTDSLLSWVVSPSFINSALKNEIWKIPLQIFVFWML